MNEDEFRTIVQNEWANVPPRFVKLIENVALLIEDEPNAEIRAKEHLKENETLLGLYQGIPHTERGSMYGVGATLPDTITLFRLPILSEAEELTDTDTSLFQKMLQQWYAKRFGTKWVIILD